MNDRTFFVADLDPMLACVRLRESKGLVGWRLQPKRGWTQCGPAAALVSPDKRMRLFIVSDRSGRLKERPDHELEGAITSTTNEIQPHAQA